MLAKKIESAIKTDKMKDIYQMLISDRTIKAYTTYTKNVSDLVGEPHTCLYIKDYFSLGFD